MQNFAQFYPDEVSALLLIKPYTIDFFHFKKFINADIYNNLINKTPNIKAAQFISKLGIIRAYKAIPYLNVPPDIKNHIVEN